MTNPKPKLGRKPPTKEQLESLISLTYLDPDEGMAADVRRYITKHVGRDQGLQRLLKHPGGRRRHNFRLFGYEEGESDEGRLLRLSEATVVVDAKEARALGKFFLRCARGISTEPRWDHEHFNGGGTVDIVVASNESVRPSRKRRKN